MERQGAMFLLKETQMKDRANRMIKSSRARKKRQLVKEIKKTIQKRYYAHMKHLREKYKKIENRHHDGKV